MLSTKPKRACVAGVCSLVGLAVLFGLLFTVVARAQTTANGSITGIVRDQSRAVIPGAAVTATNQGTNRKSSTTTDTNGRFVIINLAPGRYAVEVDAKGFGKFRQENIIVEVGISSNIDATLRLATQTTTVIAQAQAPVVTTDRPDLSTNINQATIANLPINGRRWSTFALSTPGALPDGPYGLVSFRGISGLLNNNMVDGGDNNQAFFSEEKGRTRISYSISEASIQEFQVNTSNFSAQYGRSAGGVVNAVTKSGTNQLHGEAFWYYRDSDFGAINPFAVQTVLVNGTNTVVPINPEDKRHQFGGAIGGPILKDKLFFFLSGDQQLRNFPAVAVPGNPAAFFAPLSSSELATLAGRGITASQANSGLEFLNSLSGTVPRTGDELVLFPKIDWAIKKNHHFSVEYNRMRWSSPGGIQTGAVVSRGKESFGNDYVKDDTMIARLTSSLGFHVINQGLFEYGRDFEFEFGQEAIPGEPVARTTGYSPQISIYGGGGIVFGMPSFLQRPAFPDERRLQWADTVSVTHGTHLLAFGADINRVHDLDQNLYEGFGAYSYNNRVNFISDYVAATKGLSPRCTAGTAAVGCYNTLYQGFGPLGFEFSTWDVGLFGNDEWRATPRLTLNLGLRWDHEVMPEAQIPNSSLAATSKIPSDRTDFGPRVGVAWDLTGRGTTVVRGGYGIYYGRVVNANIFNAIADTGNPTGQLTYLFRPTTSGAPLYPNIAPAPPPGSLNPPNVVVFGRNDRLPLIHEFDAVFERQIARNTAVSVSYMGSIGTRLPTYIDYNLNKPTATVSYLVQGGPFDGQSFSLPLYTGSRPNTSFGAITEISSIVRSHYNAVVFQFNRRMTNGLQVQAFYTYSHAWDTGQSSNTGTPRQNVLDPYNLSLEDGRSNFDIRHRFVTLAVWQPSYYKGSNQLARYLLNGFSLSPIITISSGSPVDGYISGSAPYGLGTTSSGVNGSGTGQGRSWWLPRNDFQMPRTAEVDLEISKSFPITERFRFQVFGQAFNLFNHMNATRVDSHLYTVGGTSSAPVLNYNTDFMVVTASSNTLIAQRQIQIGARLNW